MVQKILQVDFLLAGICLTQELWAEKFKSSPEA